MSLEDGRFRAYVQMDMWVLQSMLTIDFGPSRTLSIGRDIYGARVTDGGDGTTSQVEVSLLPLKKCLGMYKDASCNNAFGFSAVVTPPPDALPTITCFLTRSMPAPPPPKPPNPPPSPPPGFLVDRNLCYLGGHVNFVVAPHKVASQTALQTWVVAVHLDEWSPGLHIVLDFPGVTYAEHGLHVHSVSPIEVVKLLSVTRHSAILELMPTAARDFRFEALGDVGEVRVVCDIGDARPPPPPPPTPPVQPILGGSSDEVDTHAQSLATAGRSTQPSDLGNAGLPLQAQLAPATKPRAIEGETEAPIVLWPPPPPPPEGPKESGPWGLIVSLALLLFIGYHAKQAHNDPEPYMKGLAEGIRWARTTAAKSPHGRKVLAKVSTSGLGKMMFQVEARYLTLPGAKSTKGKGAKGTKTAPALELVAPDVPARTSAITPKAKGKSKKNQDETEQEEPLVGRIDGFDDDDDDDDDEEEDNEDEDEDDNAMVFAEPEEQEEEKTTATLIIKLPGFSRSREVDLRSLRDMASLQQLVAKICKSVGADVRGGMRMQFIGSGGQTLTVNKSTSISDIRKATQLTLLPKQGGGGDGNPRGDTRKPGSGYRSYPTSHVSGME